MSGGNAKTNAHAHAGVLRDVKPLASARLARADGDLARFMMRLTIRHVRRWLEYRKQVGTGHVYQGRYKSFVIQDDGHLATVCRYVKRNPVRAGMARSCRDWTWSSAGQDELPPELRVSLTEFAGLRGKDWIQFVDHPQTAAEEQAVQDCIKKNRPFGSEMAEDDRAHAGLARTAAAGTAAKTAAMSDAEIQSCPGYSRPGWMNTHSFCVGYCDELKRPRYDPRIRTATRAG